MSVYLVFSAEYLAWCTMASSWFSSKKQGLGVPTLIFHSLVFSFSLVFSNQGNSLVF